MKEEMDKIQSALAGLTKSLEEKAASGASAAEVKALSDKVEALLKDSTDRKHQFAVGQAVQAGVVKEVERKLDELFLASVLCRGKSGAPDERYSKIVERKEYKDAIDYVKASGLEVFANTTSGSGTGAEVVPVGFSSTMGEEIFLELEVAALFGRLNMPNATFTLPFSPGRLIAGGTAEGAAPNKQKAKTSKIVFDAKKAMLNVEFTDEFEADAIIAVLPFLRSQVIGGFAVAQDTMALNGDTGTTIYAAAPGAADDCRRLVDGVREDAKNAAKANNMVAFATDLPTTLRAMRASMGKYGKKPSDLAIIIDMADYNTLLAVPGFQTLYSYGAGATLLTGELGRFDGIPLVITELLPQKGVVYGDGVVDAPDALGAVTTAGIYGATDAGNIKKVCVMVNRKAYMWGDRKEFSLETWRNPANQTLNLIGSQRLDFEKVTTATNKAVAVGYNY